MKIKMINRHLPAILLFAIVSGITLVIIEGWSILPVLLIAFPVQLLVCGLLYLLILRFTTLPVETRHATSLQTAPTNDITENTPPLETVAIKTGNKLHIIPISEIICIQAYGDYVNIMTLQGTRLKEQTLKYFEEHLPEEQFIRVHRSHIVNLHAIVAIERYGREQYLLILSNKEKVKATMEGYRRVKIALKL